MSDIFKTIESVELRLQWSGTWDPLYSGTNQNGFPGLEVPMELARRLHSLKDMVLKVDNDSYAASVEVEVRKLIENVIGIEGPGTARWIPLSTAYWTTSSHIRWVPGAGANSIAFKIGKQALTAGKIDDTKPKEEFAAAYDFPSSTPKSGKATYWICFNFKP